jgi:hypothetical protein
MEMSKASKYESPAEPWKWGVETTRNVNGISIRSLDGVPVARLLAVGRGKHRHIYEWHVRAACLIAAAPELFEALESAALLLATIKGGTSDVLRNINQVIAKANPRPEEIARMYKDWQDEQDRWHERWDREFPL